MTYQNLNPEIRELMHTEIQSDLSSHRLYESKYFNENGKSKYPELLTLAAKSGDSDTLSSSLINHDCFKEKTERTTKKGISMVKVPTTASKTLSEGEFNRFYIRAVCIYAIENNRNIVVYRARQSSNPRAESESLIGTNPIPSSLLEDLRTNIGVDTALGLPQGPNSGLSIKID